MSNAIEIAPRGPLSASVRVPGSKSVSNRVLLIAALAKGRSTLDGVLDSDDIRVMARALRALGAKIEQDGERLLVDGVDGRPLVPSHTLDVHASGTATRFLTATLSLVPGECRLDGTPRLRQRPIGELVEPLRKLGVDVLAEGPADCPPVRCRGGQPFGGEVEVDASRSSQYVSALLLVAPYASRAITVRLKDGLLASRPYVDVTLETMRAFGAEASFTGPAVLRVTPGVTYAGRPFTVEPDASTAAYFFAAAAITGGRVRVPGLRRSSSQADMGFLGLLERMGCNVRDDASGIEVTGPADKLHALDVDMNGMPDAVLATAVTALFADGTTHIRNVAHLRIKESDRLAALESELGKLGARAEVTDSSLSITPRTLRAASIATYDDHRMAMAFALAGLRVPGIRIEDPGCVSKSWPGYFEAFAALR
jgi:3-phosphoshikimate 1-carboxyvinyltransferase